MTDLFLLPIVMLAVLQPEGMDHVTVMKPYSSAAECLEALPATKGGWEDKYPEAVFWCSNPIGRVVSPDLTATP